MNGLKFAVITDIHGNRPALSAVLNEIDCTKGIEHIYCLGDMIGIGPDTNEVLDILFSNKRICMITGNHDEAVLALLKGGKYPESHSSAKKHHQWVADRMNPSYIPLLQKLPREIKITNEGHRILFTHYNLDHNGHISQDPFSSIVEPTLQNIEKLFSHREFDLICFGHHHPIHYFEGMRSVYLNPGSLGCSKEALAPFCIVEVTDKGIKVDLKKARYEKTEFLLSYELLQIPDREFLLKAFHSVYSH